MKGISIKSMVKKILLKSILILTLYPSSVKDVVSLYLIPQPLYEPEEIIEPVKFHSNLPLWLFKEESLTDVWIW